MCTCSSSGPCDECIAVIRSNATRRPLPVVPCTHLGDELTGLERDARNLDHRRPWRWCRHPDKPLGEAVCGCAGCGPSCSGYAG